MLGMFQLLPLLKGWEYKVHLVYRTDVRRGAAPIELSISETGWLLALVESTNDCFGTFEIDAQGADLQTWSSKGYPEYAAGGGAVVQDPAGWVQLYRRPNPYSTAGLYVLVVDSGGFQGSPLPYVPTVKLRVSLPLESTQDSAYIALQSLNVAITDKTAFIRSLRRLLDAKASLDIDKALLAIGPAEFGDEKK